MKFALAAVAVLMLMAQGGSTQDQDDPGPPEPQSCNNASDNAHPCMCAKSNPDACKRKKPITDQDLSGNDGMNPRCIAGYCKPDHCHCEVKCPTTIHAFTAFTVCHNRPSKICKLYRSL